MRRLPALVVVLLVVVAATTALAVGAVAWAIRDHDSSLRMGPTMMTSDSYSTPGWWDDTWDSSMGMMGGAGELSEPAYLTEMIAHHQEAVTAARELTRSERPELRSFGESIVATQSAQILQMHAWLDEWYPEQSPTEDYQPMMRDLSGLSGDRLDEAFLDDMIGHHMAAVMMSQRLLWRGADHDEVADLARTIRDEQHSEIVQMQQWLAEWFDTEWSLDQGRGLCPHAGAGAGPGSMMGRSGG